MRKEYEERIRILCFIAFGGLFGRSESSDTQGIRGGLQLFFAP